MDAVPCIDLNEQPNAAELQRKLDSVFAGIERKSVLVACSVKGSSAFAVVDNSPESEVPEDTQIPLGCLAKLFTATLLEQAMAAGALALGDFVTSDVSSRGKDTRLSGITIEHLLNHMHGLDDSLLKHAPRRGDGFIDEEILVTQCSVGRLNAPGEIFSYSNAGAWIIAALLERLHESTYDAILRGELLDPLGIDISHRARDERSIEKGVCPATGGLMAISVRDLLMFLQSAIARQAFWPIKNETLAVTPFSGWHPFERGIYRGWKHYGDGWYGHSSIADHRSTAIIRVHPERKATLIVASKYHHANMVAAKLFGRSVPGYSSLVVPRALSADAAGRGCHAAHGRYRSAAETIVISGSDGGRVEALWSDRRVSLVPAERDIFLATKAENGGAGFFQALGRHNGSYRYLWDGQRVYRNERMPVIFGGGIEPSKPGQEC